MNCDNALELTGGGGDSHGAVVAGQRVKLDIKIYLMSPGCPLVDVYLVFQVLVWHTTRP